LLERIQAASNTCRNVDHCERSQVNVAARPGMRCFIAKERRVNIATTGFSIEPVAPKKELIEMKPVARTANVGAIFAKKKAPWQLDARSQSARK
jgi:hypothetical protein